AAGPHHHLDRPGFRRAGHRDCGALRRGDAGRRGGWLCGRGGSAEGRCRRPAGDRLYDGLVALYDPAAVQLGNPTDGTAGRMAAGRGVDPSADPGWDRCHADRQALEPKTRSVKTRSVKTRSVKTRSVKTRSVKTRSVKTRSVMRDQDNHDASHSLAL